MNILFYLGRLVPVALHLMSNPSPTRTVVKRDKSVCLRAAGTQ